MSFDDDIHACNQCQWYSIEAPTSHNDMDKPKKLACLASFLSLSGKTLFLFFFLFILYVFFYTLLSVNHYGLTLLYCSSIS